MANNAYKLDETFLLLRFVSQGKVVLEREVYRNDPKFSDRQAWAVCHHLHVASLMMATVTFLTKFSSCKDSYILTYCNDPKFFYSQVCANSVDPDQKEQSDYYTFTRSIILFAIPSASFGPITLW